MNSVNIKELGKLRHSLLEHIQRDSLKARKIMAKEYIALVEREVNALGIPESAIKRLYLKSFKHDIERIVVPEIYERKITHEAKSVLEPVSEENTPKKSSKKTPKSHSKLSPYKLSPIKMTPL